MFGYAEPQHFGSSLNLAWSTSQATAHCRAFELDRKGLSLVPEATFDRVLEIGTSHWDFGVYFTRESIPRPIARIPIMMSDEAECVAQTRIKSHISYRRVWNGYYKTLRVFCLPKDDNSRPT